MRGERFFFCLKSCFRNNNLFRQKTLKYLTNIKGPGRTIEVFVTFPPQRECNVYFF